MFTEAELKSVAVLCEGLEKQAGYVDPRSFDAYTLGMPALKPWSPPTPTYESAFKGMGTGLGHALGVGAQTLLTGHNTPGVMENYLRNGVQLLAHPTDPARLRALFSTKNVTEPFQRARSQFGQAGREIGEFPGMVGKEVGERYGILKGLFSEAPHF